MDLCSQGQMGKATMEGAELIRPADLNHWLCTLRKDPNGLS